MKNANTTKILNFLVGLIDATSSHEEVRAEYKVASQRQHELESCSRLAKSSVISVQAAFVHEFPGPRLALNSRQLPAIYKITLENVCVLFRLILYGNLPLLIVT